MYADENSPQPAIYIPHGGGPAFFMTGPMADMFQPMAEFLGSIDTLLPRTPSAIVVVTAHWESEVTSISGGRHDDLTYDYYGFPAETYELEYRAPGSPELAQRIADLLHEAGIESELNVDRGWDHGVFIPLKVMYPEASVPVVSLSLRADLNEAHEFGVGQALSALRADNVLIIGSGLSYHNLSSWFGSTSVQEASAAFDAYLNDAVAGDIEHRRRHLLNWRQAPFADQVHPRSEHLLPLLSAAGAGSDAPGRRIWHDLVNGAVVSAWAFD